MKKVELDNLARAMSEAQSHYFKDSKIRDESG